MDSRQLQGLVVAALAVVAVVLTAVAAGPVFAEEPVGEGADGGEPSADPDPVTREIDVPTNAVLIGILVVALLGFAIQVFREPWETFREVLKFAAVGGVFLGVMTVIYRSVTLEPLQVNDTGETGAGNQSIETTTTSPGAGIGEGSGTSGLPIENLIAIVMVGAVFGVVTLFVWQSGIAQSESGSDDESGEDDPDIDTEGVGRVAGDAADSVERSATPEAADNAIYRAWREMVSFLEAPDPRSETPRQFERAAIGAGMDPDDVSILTHAFEEVRYGDVELSEERRDRVTAALRRIEASHADPEDDDGVDSSEGAT